MNTTTTETTGQAPTDIVVRLRSLLGDDVVLLPIKAGRKGPNGEGWPQTRIEKMSDPHYLQRLRTGNIGVLLGKPCNGLCSIDVDNDADAERFMELNPQLRETLQSRGARGRNFWVRVDGDYPKLTPLLYDKQGENGKPKKWGEWRSTGGQTVIHGRHPDGCHYQILKENKPVRLKFESIIWPEELPLPWDIGLYEDLVKKQGQPWALKRGAVKINEPFVASKFAVEHVVLHEPDERRFYGYDESRGLWMAETSDSIKTQFAADLKAYADTQKESEIERLRTNGFLNGLTDMLRGEIETPDAFKRQAGIIHLNNGMLHLEERPPELREFSPSYRSRNQCPIDLIEGADCPRFKKELLESALDADDVSLLQRYCGSLLLGGNSAQRIMLLTGQPGGGKSTLVEIMENIVGLENVTELRTDQLHERFELFRFIGKTLITGKEAPAEFLMRKGAPVLKKLVGGDYMTAEGKRLNEGFGFRGEFNVMITSNCHLRVRLEGDADAWRRRLIIIDYNRPKPKVRISEFAKVLLKEEAPGILLWMILGAMAHLEELRTNGDFVLSPKQQERVNSLLAESDSVREFVRTCVRPADQKSTVTVEDLLTAYTVFCAARDFHPVAPLAVQKQLPDLIEQIHNVHKRNDIKSEYGVKRGFKGIEVDTNL